MMGGWWKKVWVINRQKTLMNGRRIAGTPTGEPLVLWGFSLADHMHCTWHIFFIQKTPFWQSLWFQILDHIHKKDISYDCVCMCRLFTICTNPDTTQHLYYWISESFEWHTHAMDIVVHVSCQQHMHTHTHIIFAYAYLAYIWGFLKIVTPQNGWFMIEKYDFMGWSGGTAILWNQKMGFWTIIGMNC